ncbi:hypothetical protein, variant [Puccinia triticina 1-1 BBBD Race 1]|uniref:Uncharacterized protein n=1 Tax=Puccinia triticina (isolate 1-1 / race 1 (BBBD)) TaxID=630390 RepID=A0A180GLM2_PUCT1|nr:hypothetical protein PTTG_11851 [Puccinia triticina 1-1 BBBD Race 1]OAV93461.1 hypothetical protein, variant [Puccinia triticina 1-1 BBBD Race 1]
MEPPSTQQRDTHPNSPEYVRELARFTSLHPGLVDPDNLFSVFIGTAGLNSVEKYHSELEGTFCSLAKGDEKLFKIACGAWSFFYKGVPDSKAQLQLTLDLNDEIGDAETINKLVKLAHFGRYPSLEGDNLTNQEMLAALANPIVHTDIQHYKPQIEWSTKIVKAGLRAKYKRSNLIIDPILADLRTHTKNWNSSVYKAPYTCIIGPSMIGKTRALMELGQHVCVVYICLRSPKSTGQPARSKLADLIFPSKSDDLILHYSKLLAAILEAMADFFSRDTVAKMEEKDQLAAWNQHSFPDDDDHEFFSDEVILKMQSLPHHPQSVAYIQEASKRIDFAINFMKNRTLKVLLAIDEARNLLDWTDDSLQISYFRVFRRVLSDVPHEKGFFAVLIDTTSRVANFAPALENDPSLRLPNRGVKLFEPIFRLATMDLRVDNSPPQTWNELVSPARLLNYGSPFFGHYYEETSTSKPATAFEETMKIAQLKLICKSTLPPADQLTEPELFALLGPTIQPQLASTVRLTSELISSHAAHCHHITPARDGIICGYPSQFVYSAAANAMITSDDKIWIACIDTLAFAVKNKMIASGDSGEMATAIILIRAMQKTRKIPGDGDNRYGCSARLVDFLATLTGKKPHEFDFGFKTKSDRDDLVNRGRIFFNHFNLIRYTPDVRKLLKFLYRGLAVQCKHQQHGLDHLFSIYLTPVSESENLSDPKNSKNTIPLNISNVTFCGIQTKNQKKAIDWSASYKWCKSYAGINGIDNPYLILLFNLRAVKKDLKIHPWHVPKEKGDTRRVYMEFHSLDSFDCLTPDMRAALCRLIKSESDVMQIHKDKAAIVEWMKIDNPEVYSDHAQSDNDQSAPTRQSPRRSKRRRSSQQ